MRIFARPLLALVPALAIFSAMEACGGGEGGGSDGSSGSTSSSGGSSSGSSSGASGSTSSGSSGSADAALDVATDVAPEPPPSVRFIGRFDTSDPAGPRVAWPGARILARFQGTQASAKLRGFTGTSLDLWDVTVDGALTKTLTLTTAMDTYDLTGPLPAGVHTVELFKRTEAYVGSTQFGGFDFGGGSLLSPPPSQNRRIEFLGDSSSNGFGVEGAGPNCTNTAALQNDHKAWPWLVAKALGADHHNVSYGGRGIYWNYTRAYPNVFKVIYPQTFPDLDGSTWSFASFTPDVVWITLGGNDYDQPNPGDPPPPYASFLSAYTLLVSQVRGHYPTATIVLAVAPSLSDFYPSSPPYNARTNVTNALNQVKASSADPKIHVFAFTMSDTSLGNGAPDLTACSYHPNAAKHAAMAAEATAFIKSKTGW